MPLRVLDNQIAARSKATVEAHAFWPCKRGCDTCCRTLASLPVITEPEWKRLEVAIADLPVDDRQDILARIHAAPATGPVICPILDEKRGECRVYDARPIVCRMHGFYTERDGGLHCDDVREAVEANDAEVLWGNGESVNDAMRGLGEARSLLDWLLSDASTAKQSTGTILL